MRQHQHSLLWLQQASVHYFCAIAWLRATRFPRRSISSTRQFDLDQYSPTPCSHS